ncbi:MAG: hypothetical protein ACTSYR_01190 [Candidatus Odinarchaeia archaeon]
MHITIEKTLGIAISLSLVIGIGIPILNLASNAINDYQKNETVLNLVNKIDYGIKLVIDKNVTYIDEIFYPENLDLNCEGNTIYFFYPGLNESIVKSYPLEIRISKPDTLGNLILCVFRNESVVYVQFIE